MDNCASTVQVEKSDIYHVSAQTGSCSCSSSNSLEAECSACLNRDTEKFNDNSAEVNTRLISYLFNNTTRADDGRLVMPLLWDDNVKHLLASNYSLCKSVLNSNLKLIKNVYC